jgi:hypothetical protein
MAEKIFMLKNKNKMLIGVIAILVIVLVVVLVFSFKKTSGVASKNNYSVVYLTTGEIYVGKLCTFPRMELKNGYFLTTVQDATDPKKTNFQLNSLSETFWSPKQLYLNRDQVVFYGPLLDTSKIAQTILSNQK